MAFGDYIQYKEVEGGVSYRYMYTVQLAPQILVSIV